MEKFAKIIQFFVGIFIFECFEGFEIFCVGASDKKMF